MQEKPQEIRRKSLTERSIDVARAVGRRLSTMFQLPTGYNFGKSPQMDDVAECEETPPTKRRESVHVSTETDDVFRGVCHLDTQNRCENTNIDYLNLQNCIQNTTHSVDETPKSDREQTDNSQTSHTEFVCVLNEYQFGHHSDRKLPSDVRNSQVSTSDLALISSSSCSSERSLLSTS